MMFVNMDSSASRKAIRRQLSKTPKESTAVRIELFESKDKGIGVRILEDVYKHQFLMEYGGLLLDKEDAEYREKLYEGNEKFFMYFFEYDKKIFCIDSTEPNDKYGYGRYINHSRRSPNIEPLKIPDSCGKPRIIFRASRNIFEGEELLFDYGDRENIKTFPWLDE